MNSVQKIALNNFTCIMYDNENSNLKNDLYIILNLIYLIAIDERNAVTHYTTRYGMRELLLHIEYFRTSLGPY